MTNPPLRKRFQIHLSTAIVLMFVAGALIWANVGARRVGDTIGNMIKWIPEDQSEIMIQGSEVEFKQRIDVQRWVGNRDYEYGWPLVSCHAETVVNWKKDGVLEYEIPPTDEWKIGAVIANAAIALLFIFAVYFLCERLRRRRSSQ